MAVLQVCLSLTAALFCNLGTWVILAVAAFEQESLYAVGTDILGDKVGDLHEGFVS